MLHAAWLPVEVCTCEEVSKEALRGHKLSMQDMAELEAAVADYLLPVDAVGAPHRVLRAFRPLIFLGTPELAASLLVAALPPSIVLHHMYSRAPAALQSPHIRSGFTPAQVRCLAPRGSACTSYVNVLINHHNVSLATDSFEAATNLDTDSDAE